MPFISPEAKKQYQREWLVRRRAEGIAYLGGKCVKCGTSENLQVDHIDPKSKVAHRIWSWSADRRRAELDKCQLLCEAHHREKTVTNKECAQGEAVGGAKLTRALVVELREKYATGTYSYRSLGEEYGLPKTTVAGAVKTKWRSVQ